MKNWFLISVAIVLLSFSTIHLIIKDSTNKTLEFAPESPNCKNTESYEDSFRSGKAYDRQPGLGLYIYPTLCRKKGAEPPKFAFTDATGACPQPVDDWKNPVFLPTTMVCGVGKQLKIVTSPVDPVHCAKDCLDMGVVETTEPVLGTDSNVACRVKKVRTCIPQPA